jgi:hypothetical protein
VPGLLLEAPATFWIQPAKEQFGFITPIVGQVHYVWPQRIPLLQTTSVAFVTVHMWLYSPMSIHGHVQVFEVLGFRISFQWHLIRAVLDFAGSLASVCINVHLGWANSLHTRIGVTKNWEVLFFLQYIVSGFGFMTGLMYFVERLSLRKFLGSADMGKLHGTDSISEGEQEGAELSTRQTHLTGTLREWVEAHKRWVPVCKTQVLTLKFNGPDFASLTQSTCTEIRRQLLQNRSLPSICSSVGFIDGCIQVRHLHPRLRGPSIPCVLRLALHANKLLRCR